MAEVVGPLTAVTVIDSVMLARTGGDRELLAEVIELFLEDCPARVENIRTGLAEGDSAAVAMAAHSLVGSTASLGADDVTVLARDLETHARAGNAAASRNAFTPLEGAVLQLQERLAVVRAALQCAS